MKHKLKEFLLLQFLIGTLFVSCSLEEEVVRSDNYSKKFKIYEMPIDEITLNKEFMKSINILNKRGSKLKFNTFENNRTQNSYNFTITDYPVRLTEVGTSISYTFHIVRDSTSNNIFENLVIQNDNSDNIAAYIIKYKALNSIETYPNHNSYTFNGEVEITNLEFDAQIFGQNKMVTECRDLYGFRCTGDNRGCTAPAHIPIGICTDLTPECIKYMMVGQSCSSYDDGLTDIDTGGGAGSSSGQFGGGGGNTPIYSDPLCPSCPELESDVEENPCTKLKNGTSNAEFKQKFKELNTNAYFGLNHESGFGQVGSNYINGTPIGPKRIRYPNGSKNGTHVHNNNPMTNSDGYSFDANVKMLSPEDVLALIQMQDNNSNPLDTFHIMLSNEGIFAVTILQNIPLPLDPLIFKKIMKWNKDYKSDSEAILIQYETPEGRKDQLQKLFLRGLKEVGLVDKIGLFEAEIENEYDTDIDNYNIKWSRNKLNKNFFTISIEKTPCN